MFDLCLFAGTTEGRRLVEFLRETPLSVYVSVATEYGETLVPQGSNITVHAGRLDRAQMAALFARERSTAAFSGSANAVCMQKAHSIARSNDVIR